MRTTSTFPLCLLLSLVSLSACGHGAPGGFSQTDASAHDAAGSDAPATGDDSSPQDDASNPPDGATSDEAGEDDAAVSPCVGVGGQCKDSTSCLCGLGSGCTYDNVDCDAGICAVAYPVVDGDGGDCCASCQSSYDACKSGAPACLSAWKTCNATCPGSCPVVCLAAQAKPGGG